MMKKLFAIAALGIELIIGGVAFGYYVTGAAPLKCIQGAVVATMIVFGFCMCVVVLAMLESGELP